MARRGPKVQTPENSRGGAVPGPVRWRGIKAPDHLGPDAAVEYVRLARLLKAAGTLERTDPRLVELYAISYTLIRQAQADVDRDGLTLQVRRGVSLSYHPHPMLAVINSATLRLKAIINDLGLAPSSSKHGGTAAGTGGRSGAGPDDSWEGILKIG